MKTSISLFALLTACTAVIACGGVAPDDLGTASSELTGVEPDEIDCDGTATATTEYDARGVTTSTTESPLPPKAPADVDCRGTAVGSANGGIWKTTNGGTSANHRTYGPVITVKPKG